ncbi:MAG: phospholipase [Desulfuromonas sp.]|uniref:phospholipase A n=1 Tax=Desulfuromonas sp. TaxID=892 RepID=UPI000CB175BC|nr:phospholipase A [Desulfuromonas sp.]PLX82283.1 MAG: phospholipase [Desulfuromonas sp.]
MKSPYLLAGATFLLLLLLPTGPAPVFAQEALTAPAALDAEGPQCPPSAADIEANPSASAIVQRRRLEERAAGNRFAFLPYKPSYLLPFTYNATPNRQVYQDLGDDVARVELKFQLSFKMPLWEGIFADRGTLFAGYTQQSYWQAYNSKSSSPFRETNYEPELFLNLFNDLPVLGVRNRMVTLGLVHQSNGRGGDLSRSWNRLYAQFAFERGNLYFALRPWYRIPEKSADDDNPDIDKYLGHGEFYAVYALGKQRLGLMLRNNLRSENKGAVQLDWSFPLHKKLDGYVQYFNGYGENLIEYDSSNNRIGFGLILANWL